MTITQKLKSFYSHHTRLITLLSYLVIFVPGLHGHSIIPFVVAIVYGTAMDLAFNVFSTLQILLITWFISLVVSWLRLIPVTIRLISTMILLGIMVFALGYFSRLWLNGDFTFWVLISFIPSLTCHTLNVFLAFSEWRSSKENSQPV